MDRKDPYYYSTSNISREIAAAFVNAMFNHKNHKNNEK